MCHQWGDAASPPPAESFAPPQEVAVTLSLSQEVLSYFQAGGQGWLARADGRSGSGLPHTDQHRHTCALA
ncbi:MAG TPA: hypothetical protein EYQ29_13475 [Candidatus Lambdaproteobacteria bacterium]|nr:hypothetical protein [Candidatus Lambdaproteobacteria bacterium]